MVMAGTITITGTVHILTSDIIGHGHTITRRQFIM